MCGIVHGISWFENIPEKFVAWGSEINLYEAKPLSKQEDNSDHSIRISSNFVANLLASETRFHYIRCLATSYNKEALLATGLANGRVGICNFDQVSNQNLEFTPRQQRTCLCLAWNNFEPNLLAIGHDRNRSDYCITVWDTERGTPSESCNLIGHAETAHSLCWNKNSRILGAGMSQKSIKLFDLRQGSSSRGPEVNTRLVHGLCFSNNGYYLGSYVDTVVGVWDLRNIEKPLAQIQTLKNVTRLAWCPIRSELLSFCQRDSSFFHLIDFHSPEQENCFDVYSTKRVIAPLPSKSNMPVKCSTIADISWHPLDLQRVLVLSETGNIYNFYVPPRIAVYWDNFNNLSCSVKLELGTVNRSNPSAISSSCKSLINFAPEYCNDDIGKIMYKRALNDYGLISDIKKNADLTQNSNLKSVWNNLDEMTRDERIVGIKTVLGISSTADGPCIHRSDNFLLQWPDFINSSNTLTTYRSEQRTLAQVLSGWSFSNDVDELLNKFIPDLCDKKEFSRAAMICVFYVQPKIAVEILTKATDQSSNPSVLQMAAVALSGFNADVASSMWRNQRTSPFMQINDAYLRAIFGFLIAENDNFDAILMEQQISLGDRMAFACKYLSDFQLVEYVTEMIKSCVDTGDLNGLLLSGDLDDGVNILQSFLDRTDDIQTVSLIAIRFFRHKILSDSCVQHWISSYRDLLDIWGLWEKRAEFDIKIEILKPNLKLSRSVFLLCNFCGKSVSSILPEETRLRNSSSSTNKLSSCPHCRKPLPRCSLCLLYMGTSLEMPLHNSTTQENLGWQSKPFSKWFSWCQTCNHGGHAEHLMSWFRQNSECPITACSCKCFSLDVAIPALCSDTL